jgi:hypothetical protein
MRYLLPLMLLAGLATAVEPYFGINAAQPLVSEIHANYRLMPGASLGVRLPRTATVAFRGGGAGFLGFGSGEYSEMRLASAALELGVELRSPSALGVYVTPSILAGYAAERIPAYDRTTGAIYDRWNGGTSLGFGLNIGAVLFRSGRLLVDAEAGCQFLSVPPDGSSPRPTDRYYWYPYYSGIDASAFGVGLVARFAPPEPESGRE